MTFRFSGALVWCALGASAACGSEEAVPADTGGDGGSPGSGGTVAADASTGGGGGGSGASLADGSAGMTDGADASGATGGGGGGPADGGSGSLRFVAWGDTKDGTAALIGLSPKALALQPRFTLYSGDLVPDGFTQASGTTWKDAMNGGTNDGLFDLTFTVRGNHELDTSTAAWQAFFDQAGTAQRVGATQYAAMDEDLTYSFDHGNAHFIGVDVLGDATLMTAAQLTWIDGDLTSAEGRGVTHAFLFWHGPIYPVAEHCCTTNPAIVDVINKHPIVSATFHGHEHVYAYVHMNASRMPNVTHEFEQFVTGDAGAGPDVCQAGRTDYCQDQDHGFVTVDVSGRKFDVAFYTLGGTGAVKQMSFTKP